MVLPAILGLLVADRSAVINTPAGPSLWTSTTLRAPHLKVHPRFVAWIHIREGGL